MNVRDKPFVFLLQNTRLSDRHLRSESTKADLDSAARIPDAALGRMMLASQLMARRALQKLLGFDPADRFERSFFAKPYLPGSDIHFNLSNSRKAAALIVSRTHQCGVDIEHFRLASPLHNRAKQFMSEREYRSFAELNCGRERAWRIVEAWSRKEAFLKSLGVGRAFPSQRVEFEPTNCMRTDLWYSATTGFAVRTFRMLGHALSVCLRWEQMSALRIYCVSLDRLVTGTALPVHPATSEPVAIRVLDTSRHPPFPTQGV